MTERIRASLFSLQDPAFRDFQAKLIPTVNIEAIIGVRTPSLRKLSNELAKERDIDAFLCDLPHKYLEENSLHGFIIEKIKDFNKAVDALEKFLPYVDNWATCDCISPKVLKMNSDKLRPAIDRWLVSGHTYTVRFAVCLIMRCFLGDDFDKEYADKLAYLRTEEYYIQMAVAWYFATALAENYDDILPYIENHVLCEFTHKKSIRKACESFRVTSEHKTYLRKLM